MIKRIEPSTTLGRRHAGATLPRGLSGRKRSAAIWTCWHGRVVFTCITPMPIAKAAPPTPTPTPIAHGSESSDRGDDGDGSARSGNFHHFAVGTTDLVRRCHPELPQAAAIGDAVSGSMKAVRAGRSAARQCLP